ncbi:crossover junction endodeoxyribonuclease RuvC [Candidatus Kaiserbacteria bacterium RIFCSPHIGHO2_01_FULL_53_29]|uniref:Crossover junction endodeoxyribonuclease RuvC n=1 Tax=Candidatus Kaiserbacteria bacterium RIFCSPHIGHO2_01_FULL_53_29 TaxID=1798480 RepID=A0A1F6CTB2_9BACT|nr:MAG: crossover junction endodeoxyribonuclease RuvC [Candidatus Kaiserbacteria bacterium RIFCSPHIGHO2_01_FULL_53_29]
MRVLAIDPGYGRCGVAVVEKNGGSSTSLRAGKEILLYSACIKTPASMDFPERLAIVADECARLIKTHEPDCLAMEKLYFSTNQKTAMRVAEVRGALLSTANNAGLKVFEYTPGEVKSAAAGSGSADKKAVAQMLRALVKIEKKIEHDDEYDAIAIAVTHLARVR